MELSAESQPTQQRRRLSLHFPAFDGLRAIAALAVAMTHAAFASGYNIRNNTLGPFFARLDIGVAIFFVISGFLLYRPFVLARLRTVPAPEPVAYFQRRFLRIFPAFWFVLTVVLIFPPFHGQDWRTPTFGGLIAHYTLTHIYFHDHVLGPVQQSWTLATEVSFYIFLPIYAFVMKRTGRDQRRQLVTELIGFAVLYAISIAFRIWAFYGPPASFNGQYNTWLPARIDLFALGMLLAVGSAWLQVREQQEPGFVRSLWFPWVCWGIALASFWYLSVGFGLNDPKNRGPSPTFSHPQQMWLQFFWGVTAFFMVAPAVFGPQDQGLIRRGLNNRVLQWLGLISYGIYLWHETVIDWYLRLTHATPADFFHLSFLRVTLFMLFFTIIFAAISYYVVEKPALRLKNRDLRGWIASRSGLKPTVQSGPPPR